MLRLNRYFLSTIMGCLIVNDCTLHFIWTTSFKHTTHKMVKVNSTCTRLIQFFKTFLKQLLHIFLSILLSLLTPLIVLTIILPIHIHRFLLSKYVLLVRPSIGQMLTTRSSVFATDALYSSPSCNICVLLTLEGDLTREEFKTTLQQSVIEARTNIRDHGIGNEGQLIFPELTKYLYGWGWFYFWRPVKNFNIDNHIITPEKPLSRVPEGEPEWDHERTLEYNTSLIHKPWVNGQSPWEFHLIRNFQPFENTRTEYGLTGLLLRCHHSLSDGHSVFHLLTIATKKRFDWAKPNKPVKLMKKKKKLSTSLFAKILFPLRIPYDGIKTLFESYDVNPWHGPGSVVVKNPFASSLYTGYVPIFPIATLKQIKSHYGISTTAVILAIFTCAVRNAMIQTGNKVPKVVHALCPLPLPGHPKKLRNYMTGCYMELPVGTADPLKRLYKINRNLQRIKNSTFPWTGGVVFSIVGGLYSWMMKPLVPQRLPTCLVTNFPGPEQRIDVYGRTMTEINFGGGLMLGNMCVGMSSLSYDGNISILIGIDKGIPIQGLCDEESQVGPTLAKFVLDQVELLQKLIV